MLSFHLHRVFALVAALALAAPAVAAPMPAGGQFPVAGAPTFMTGAWLSVSPDSGVRISVIKDNQIGTWNLGVEHDATLHGSYLVIQSFKCLDANTAAIMVAGVRPTDNMTISSCSVSYVNATHALMRWLAVPASDPQDACPDSPFGDAPEAVTVVYKRALGAGVPPASLVCKNESSTPAALLGAEAVLPGSHGPKLPPRAPYPQPGGTGLNNFVAIVAGEAHLTFATEAGYAAVSALPATAYAPQAPTKQVLSLYAATYTDHECLGPKTYRAYSYEVKYYINGTVSYYYACELGRSETLGNGTTVLHLALPKAGKNATDCPADLFDSPNAGKLTLTLVDDLPWKPKTECTGGSTSPSPQPSPAPPSGASATSRLTALAAALLFMLI